MTKKEFKEFLSGGDTNRIDDDAFNRLWRKRLREKRKLKKMLQSDPNWNAKEQAIIVNISENWEICSL